MIVNENVNSEATFNPENLLKNLKNFISKHFRCLLNSSVVFANIKFSIAARNMLRVFKGSIATTKIFILLLNAVTIVLIFNLVSHVSCAEKNYNSVYNQVITSELKNSIKKELPKEAKFFDELDRKFYINN